MTYSLVQMPDVIYWSLFFVVFALGFIVGKSTKK